MRLDILPRALVVVTLSGFLLYVVLLSYFFPISSMQGRAALLIEDVTAGSSQEQANTKIELPVRLKIPSIDVDASVDSVGLTSDGAMDVPKNPDEVAWFHLGSRPGQIGTAVMAGHYDWINNKPAVFDHLDKLRIGDKISVEDEHGVVITFVVRETRVYDNDEIVPEVFGSNDGKAHLNLITCTGSWNKAKKTYSERLVVFTDKE